MRKLLYFIYSHYSSHWALIGCIAVLAISTRCIYFGYPNQIVFDELYFAKFVTSYTTQSYYFDIHPPLAKLIMSEGAALVGYKPDVSFQFKNISEVYTNNFYKLLRGIVSLFGILLPLVLYGISYELFKRKGAAFIAGLLAVFDNALLVQSRYILTDIFFLTFGMIGLYLVLRARRYNETKKYFTYIGVGALFLAACVSVKWTGLLFVGVAMCSIIFYTFLTKRIHRGLTALLGVIIIILVFYTGIFAIHFHKLPYSGDGDVYMSTRFQSTLIGNKWYNNPPDKQIPSSFSDKMLETNIRMYTASASITQSHPYGSYWYTWPLMERPIYYWYGSPDAQGNEGRIYFIGNPLIWYGGLCVMILLTLYTLFIFLLRKENQNKESFLLILLGFWCNLLPYILITRVAFLYHYLPSLLFLIIGLGYFMGTYFKKLPYLFGIFCVLIVVLFIYFAPLSYGTYLNPSMYEARVWFPLWK